MHSTRKTFRAMTMLGALAIGSLTIAQSAAAATPSKQDSAFVKKASAAGMTEVQASKLADSRSQSADIKSFATTMVADHTKAGDELSTIAQKDGFTASPAPMPSQQKALAKLESLNGAAFDKAYSSMMLKDHNEAVALFKKESTAGKNADLKSFAGETLPTLQQHLAMAKKLCSRGGIRSAHLSDFSD